MKKVYMSPVMDIIELKNQQTLLAGSVQAPFGEGTQDGGNAAAPEFDIEIPEPPYLMLPE